MKITHVLITMMLGTLLVACDDSSNLTAQSKPIAHEHTYYVIAKNGLNIRDRPSLASNVLQKASYGEKIYTTHRYTDKHILTDNTDGKEQDLVGKWLKIKIEKPFLYYVFNPEADVGIEEKKEEGYIFDSFVVSHDEFVKDINKKIRKFKGLEDYQVAGKYENFYFQADIFGDGVSDDVIRVEDKANKVKIVILNNGQSNYYKFLDISDDFSRAEHFYKVNRGSQMFSNMEPVPEVTLDYDAMYLAFSEQCGGGFVYWKNNRFNWLDQE